MRYVQIITMMFAMSAFAEQPAPAPTATEAAATTAAPAAAPASASTTSAQDAVPEATPIQAAIDSLDDVTLAPPMQGNIDVKQIPPLDERNSTNLEDVTEAVDRWQGPRRHGMRGDDDTVTFSSVTTTSIVSRTQGGFQGGGTTTMFTQRVDNVRYHVNAVFGPSNDVPRYQAIPVRQNVGDETGTVE